MDQGQPFFCRTRIVYCSLPLTAFKPGHACFNGYRARFLIQNIFGTGKIKKIESVGVIVLFDQVMVNDLPGWTGMITVKEKATKSRNERCEKRIDKITGLLYLEKGNPYQIGKAVMDFFNKQANDLFVWYQVT